MLPTAIITFREVLEAALIIGIVMAASRAVPRRVRWIAGGVGVGVAASCLVAAFAEAIAEAAAGIGQELLNATILFLAVLMLGWHNVWMGKHGREMATHAADLGKLVTTGARPLYALAIAVGMAVLREGSELVLFLYGIATGGTTTTTDFVAGGFIGLAGGVFVGATLYWGLLRIPMRHIFSVTSALILLLAAGLAAQGAAFLAQADILPAFGDALWDTSWLLGDDDIVGKVMHTLIGYVARPSGIQLLFWAATILVIGLLMRLNRGAPPKPTRTPRGRAVAAVLGALIFVSTLYAGWQLTA